MRQYLEPTARNLLRRPLVLGVPVFGLSALGFLILAFSVIAGRSIYGNLIALSFGFIGYAGLLVMSRFAKTGWEESLFWKIEHRIRTKNPDGRISTLDSGIELTPPDALDEAALTASKAGLLEVVTAVKPGERKTFVCRVDEKGAIFKEVIVEGRFDLSGKLDFGRAIGQEWTGTESVYSLYQLPVFTDPLFLFSVLSRIPSPVTVVVSIRGVDFTTIKRRIEISRRRSSHDGSSISNIDSEVTFEESSAVLKGLSRGDEAVTELSLILISKVPLDIDQSLFCLEKDPVLSTSAALGIRKRFQRSHFVRAVTAVDLIPNLIDPVESGASILTTLRRKPLYFSPNDSRLEALHWLVIGASGSGKSFFTGVVLKRMIEGRVPMSVIFIDHNRSFRRLVRLARGTYSEPKNFRELETASCVIFDELERVGGMVGIELSDLAQDEKKIGAQIILDKLETFLRFRESIHPVYVVLDECWNFMRDEPVRVQRAFREFRKLNGAAIAITQSLSDFLTDQCGQSIFQNAPIRILLRQGEDLTPYQGILNLNLVELAKVRSLRQKRGVYSECLIKTPFLSRFGRLYPTEVEHSILRTDNLREELIAETRAKGRATCVTSL